MEAATFLVVESVHGEQTHALLKSKGWLNANLESLQTSDGSIGFPLVGFDHEDNALNALRNHLGIEASIVVGETKYRPSVDPCLLYTSPSPRDRSLSRMPSSA